MASRPDTLIAVYADESCLGNGMEGDNPGGAGGLIQIFLRSDLHPVQRDYWISEPATTNNRMALRSAITAFKILSAKQQRLKVLFTSDSQYLVHGMTVWARDWITRGWRRKSGSIVNLDLWQELMKCANEHDHSWRWLKGHAWHPQNEYANHLATRAAATQTSSPSSVPSAFDEWLAAERSRPGSRMTREADKAPDPRAFRAGCTLPSSAAERLL
ncbi:MAG: ribonuclease H [Gemmatimonadaceae bacterium]